MGARGDSLCQQSLYSAKLDRFMEEFFNHQFSFLSCHHQFSKTMFKQSSLFLTILVIFQ